MRDKDVRAAILNFLSTQHASDLDTRIVQEMGVWSGTVRIDVAVINGELSGYELKSDRDTLERLPYQAKIYSRVFDRLSLVVGAKHAEKATKVVPPWWGIIVANSAQDYIRLDSFRAAKLNPSPDPYLVAELLSKEEAIEVLEIFEIAKGWRSRRVKEIHERLATELSFSELAANVRAILKRRQGWLREKAAD